MEISEPVRAVCEQIAERFHPRTVILFSNKRGLSGETGSFKLCVVMDTQDSRAAERDIYLGVESGVPFDVLVYSPEEWRKICAEEHSFAHRIIRKGAVIYGQAS